MPSNENIEGAWFRTTENDPCFVIRCPDCDKTMVAGFMVDISQKVGLEAAMEWIEFQSKQQWNLTSECKHIIFDIKTGVELQDVWIEWAQEKDNNE